MTSEALKHHELDRLPKQLLNSRYFGIFACLIYTADEFKTERDSTIALITEYHSKNLRAPSFAAASIQRAAPSSVSITSLGPLNHNSHSFLHLIFPPQPC